MADYLSRMSSDNDLTITTGSNAELNLLATTIFGGTDIPVLLSHELQEATINNAELQAVLQRVTDGWESKSAVAAELRPYFDVRDTLSRSDDGLLMKDSIMVIPRSLRRRALELAHEGHPGIIKMKQRYRSTIWWPGINANVELCVQHCMPCAVSGKSTRATSAPLQSILLPLRSWHTLAIDIFGEVQWAPSSQRFLIVLYDLHSKWLEVATSSHVTSDTVITFLPSSRTSFIDTVYRKWLSLIMAPSSVPPNSQLSLKLMAYSTIALLYITRLPIL